MRKHLRCVLCLALAVVIPNIGCSRDCLRVTASPDKSVYLPSEPMVFRVCIKNVGSKAVDHVDNYHLAWDIGFYVAVNHGDFVRYSMDPGYVLQGVNSQPPTVLRPGESVSYTFAESGVFPECDKTRKFKWVFDKIGTYQVKCAYPRDRSVPLGCETSVGYLAAGGFVSNTFEIHIPEPSGIDGVLWHEIERSDVLPFVLRTEYQRADAARRALGMLRGSASSDYDKVIRSALKDFVWTVRVRARGSEYDRNVSELVGEIQAALENPRPTERGPFIRDRRLDRVIVQELSSPSSLADAVESVSRKCGVPLRLATELENGTIASGWGVESVRTFMRLECIGGRRWVCQADGGYILLGPAANSKDGQVRAN
jgi:hypothetical protein